MSSKRGATHRKLLLLAGALVAVLPSAGCLFTSIGEDLAQQSCVDEPRSFCGELDSLQPTGDACLAWSCDSADGVCKVLPFDEDGDGAPSAECAPSGVVGDCDDTDAARTPDREGKVNAEVCDGVDNDCDDVVDEGAYTLDTAAQLLPSENMSHFSVAQNSATNEARFVYANSLDSTGVLKTALEGDDTAVQLTLGGAMASVQSTAMQFLPNRGYIVATGRGDGQRPLRVGTLSGNNIEASASRSNVSALALQLVGDTAFVGGYLERSPNPSDFCGSLASVQVQLFEGTHTSSLSDSSLHLGDTKDPSPPAFVARNPSSWLVAYASDNQSIEIGQGSIGNLGAGVTTLLSHGTQGEPGEVSMAISNDGSQLAVAYREGCGNAISLKLLLLGYGDGALTAQAELTLPSGNAARRPFVLRRSEPSPGWIVAWEDTDRVAKLSIISEEGAEVGVPYTLFQSTSGMRHGVRLLPGPGNDIAAYAVSSDGVQRTHLRCSAQ